MAYPFKEKAAPAMETAFSKTHPNNIFSHYAKQGFSVFPIQYGTKIPAIGEWKPFQSSRASAEQLLAWDRGGFNIAIVTGEISSIFVLDIDGEDGKVSLESLIAKHGKLPETRMVKSGKGLHYYFRFPVNGQNIRNGVKVLPGIDARGNGGYIIAPPSLHPNGKYYQWMNEAAPIAEAPGWLIELLSKKPKSQSIEKTDNKLSHDYLEKAFRDEISGLRATPEGQRNDRLNTGAFNLGQLIPHGLAYNRVCDELMQAAVSMGLGGDESAKTISSGMQAGIKSPRQLKGGGGTNTPPQQWPEPVLFKSFDTPPIPIDGLPENLQRFILELSEATETPKEMSLACVLGVLSIAVTGKFQICPKYGWFESLNLYWFIELPPANLKSKVVKATSHPLMQWELKRSAEISPEIEKADSYNKTLSKRIEKLRNQAAKAPSNEEFEEIQKQILALEEQKKHIPVLPRLFANNVTPEALENLLHEQGGFFGIISDEGGVVDTLAGLYNTKGKANVDVFLKGIDGGDVRIKRAERDISMNPFLTCILCVQPVVRERMAENQNLQGNGAIERLLYVIPKSKVGYRTHDTQPLQEAVEERYTALITKLLDHPFQQGESGRIKPRTLTLTPDAKEARKAFQLWLEPQLRKGAELHYIQGWGGKITGFAMRIAGLLHLSHGYGETTPVSKETVDHALDIARALIEHAKVAFQLSGLDKAVLHAMRVYDWIIAKGLASFTRTELSEAMRHHLKAKQIDDAMDVLVDRHIVWAGTAPGNGSKPVTIYHSNPKLFSQSPEETESSESSPEKTSETSEFSITLGGKKL